MLGLAHVNIFIICCFVKLLAVRVVTPGRGMNILQLIFFADLIKLRLNPLFTAPEFTLSLNFDILTRILDTQCFFLCSGKLSRRGKQRTS